MRRHSQGVEEAALLAGPRDPWPPGWTAERVIETLGPLTSEERRARLASVISERISSVTLLMDAPHDPHNGAAVLRSADAFGLPEVHLVPRAETFRIAKTVTRGVERWVEVVVHATPRAAVGALTERGFELVATHPEGELVPEDLASVPRLALLFGNEHDGLRPELLAAARRRVRVPMRGFVESLNMSVAAGVLLAAATRSRQGDLDPDERCRLYAKGLFLSVARAADVLAASSPGRSALPRPR